MIILNNPISRTELKEYAANTFGDMIKGNPSRDVLDKDAREMIASIVNQFITE